MRKYSVLDLSKFVPTHRCIVIEIWNNRCAWTHVGEVRCLLVVHGGLELLAVCALGFCVCGSGERWREGFGGRNTSWYKNPTQLGGSQGCARWVSAPMFSFFLFFSIVDLQQSSSVVGSKVTSTAVAVVGKKKVREWNKQIKDKKLNSLSHSLSLWRTWRSGCC